MSALVALVKADPTGVSYGVSGLALLALLVTFCAFAFLRGGRHLWLVIAAGVSGLFLGPLSALALGAAFLAKREEHWPVWSFGFFAWGVVISAPLGLAALVTAARRGSRLATSLIGLAVYESLASVIAYLWTISPTVRAFVAWLDELVFLATHG